MRRDSEPTPIATAHPAGRRLSPLEVDRAKNRYRRFGFGIAFALRVYQPSKKRAVFMNCTDLAGKIEQLQPNAETRDVARLCLLLSNSVDNLSCFEDDHVLTSHWREICLRIQAATDQHAAMTEELESLARSDPKAFSPEQIWVLIRAIKVQGQILQLYVGSATAEA